MSNQFGAGWTGGLLILHVDNAMGTNQHGATAHQGVVVELANTTAMGCNMLTSKTCYGKQQTFFYSSNNSSYNSSTTPASKYYNGTPSFRALDNISASGDAMTATFSIGGTAPVGSIKVNSGSIYTSSTSVTLNLSAVVAAPSTLKDMCFSNDGSTWSTWEAYKTTKAWSLDAGSDGNRTVMVKYRDAGGNESILMAPPLHWTPRGPQRLLLQTAVLVGPPRHQ